MSRANPTLVGAFVLAGLGLAVAAVVALGAQGTSGQRLPFVVQLQGTVNGLRVGAPVKYKGIEIGTVERIAIRIPSDPGDVPIAVVCGIDEARLESASVGKRPDAPPPCIRDLVAAGLRARLATESIVTGILYIALTFEPPESGMRFGDLDDVPEIPAMPSSSEVFESGIGGVLTKLQALDLAGLVDQARIAAKTFGDLGGSREVRDSLQNLDASLSALRRLAEGLERDATPLLNRLSDTADRAGTLAKSVDEGVGEARRFIEHLDHTLGPFTSSLSTAANDVGTAAANFSGTLGSIDGSTHPNAPLIVELQAALTEFAAAARAARSLLEQLDRDPSQLLRGRSLEAGGSR